ncbi:MAG: lipoyl synthase [Chloroflexi bacterium]|nr:lipoyl synthase [Chloroflexota bacterium]MCI0799629.1 lipoyl synthase [Chloroflexota bacterium]MCI0859180.1 lipoyl synthase [Chloroflexota bacterium]MCI0866819.1 lipoyl synthase [Chloroflexota bacterium]MCI0895900.1 lipoyl synthase [Chloroflexota bacterium]
MEQTRVTAAARPRLPEWLKVPMPGGPRYIELQNLMRSQALHTVCEEAHCPNIGECWDRGTATFMILGDICTRRCHYCAVTTGRPLGIDLQEPGRLADTVKAMGLRYCVITSVNRDDLSDGGAFIFASCIKKIRSQVPGCRVEVLIPDFAGSWPALKKVIDVRPDVLNHNIESPKRVFPKVRPKGDYRLSLDLLAQAKELDPATVTKSGIIVGMGETTDELVETMQDLRGVDCDLLTIGQYLRPSAKHLPVDRFYTPAEFDELGAIGRKLGFKHVASGPLVRSSYHADEQHDAAYATSALAGGSELPTRSTCQ